MSLINTFCQQPYDHMLIVMVFHMQEALNGQGKQCLNACFYYLSRQTYHVALAYTFLEVARVQQDNSFNLKGKDEQEQLLSKLFSSSCSDKEWIMNSSVNRSDGEFIVK